MKSLFVYLSAFLALGISLCGSGPLATQAINGAKGIEPKEADKTTMTNTFTLGGWLQLYDLTKKNYSDQIKQLSEDGMNTVFFPGWTWEDKNDLATMLGSNAKTQAYWDYIDKACGDNRMKYFINTGLGVDKTIEMASTLKNCAAYYLKDEPSAAQIPDLATTYKEYIEKDTNGIFPYVNLFPNYAGSTNLGGTFENYIRNWVNSVGADNIDHLYFDHYPFTAAETYRSSYFSDLETVRNIAYENGRIKTGGFTQMGSWNGMRRPTVDMARWSINSLLTYGVKAICHFCWTAPGYVAPPKGEGMNDFVLTSSGEETDLYEPVVAMNHDILAMGDALMKIDCRHAYHTDDEPGTESLPKNFFFRPKNSDAKLVISLFTSKDDSETYLMVFNKSTTDSVTESFSVNPDVGIEGIGAFNTSSKAFDPIVVSDDSITLSLKAGDMKLIKLTGNVIIPEALKAPKSNQVSGTYRGSQNVTFANETGVEIHYTLDGSYPTASSPKYEESIPLVLNGEFSEYRIRAVAIREDEISPSSTFDYILTNGVANAAYRKKVSSTFTPEAFNSTPRADLNYIVDGYNDLVSGVVASPKGKPGFAKIDMGQIYSIDKMEVALWHDWAFNDVIIQLSSDADFTSPKTIYNSDTDNSVGVGVGTSPSYTENGSHTFSFDAYDARYIRVYDVSAQTGQTIITEVKAFTHLTDPANTVNLSSSSKSSWSSLGTGSNWSYSGGVFKQSGEYNTSTWDRSFSYMKTKFDDFIIEGQFSMDGVTSDAWGYAGFGIYRDGQTDTQSVASSGIYVGVEPRGRVLVWNGYQDETGAYVGRKEYGSKEANIAGFNSSSFKLKVIAYNDVISVSVNDEPIYYYRDPSFNRNEGYISIHAGLLPISVSNLKITPLTGLKEYKFDENITSLDSSISVAVPLYTDVATLRKVLPTKADAIGSDGVTYKADVAWDLSSYNRNTAGYYSIIGSITSPLAGLHNYESLKVEAKVFVKPVLDTTALEGLFQRVEGLTEADYTSASWANLIDRYNSAKTVYQDEYSQQNDIGVVTFQLYDAIYALVRIGVDKTELSDYLSSIPTYDESKYTKSSYAIYKTALAAGEAAIADGTYSQESVDSALNAIKEAEKALVERGDVSTIKTLLDQLKAIDQTNLSSMEKKRINSLIKTAEDAIANEDFSKETCTSLQKSMQSCLSETKVTNNTNITVKMPVILPISIILAALGVGFLAFLGVKRLVLSKHKKEENK